MNKDISFESNINIVPLDARIQKLASDFYCGNCNIDSFLKGPRALDDGFGKTFAWLEADNKRIIGFYNIGTGSIDYDDGSVRSKMGGSIHINDFALDERYHGTRITEANLNMSDLLLADCIERILFLRRTMVGFSFVSLQSTQLGYGLYTRHDFEPIEEEMFMTKIADAEEECMAMYLPLDLE